MLDRVKNCIEHGLPIPLRLDQSLQHSIPAVRPRLFFQPGEHRIGSLNGADKRRKQFCFCDTINGGELARPVAPIHCASDSGHCPLPKIALKMEQQIADAVAVGVQTPPDLRVIERGKRAFDLDAVILDQAKARVSQEPEAG